jgi:hypothetical protein
MLKKYHELAFLMEINRILPALSEAMVDIENGSGKVSENDACVKLVRKVKETKLLDSIEYYSGLFYGKNRYDEMISEVYNKSLYSEHPLMSMCEAIGIILNIVSARLNSHNYLSNNDRMSMSCASGIIEYVCKKTYEAK